MYAHTIEVLFWTRVNLLNVYLLSAMMGRSALTLVLSLSPYRRQTKSTGVSEYAGHSTKCLLCSNPPSINHRSLFRSFDVENDST